MKEYQMIFPDLIAKIKALYQKFKESGIKEEEIPINEAKIEKMKLNEKELLNSFREHESGKNAQKYINKTIKALKIMVAMRELAKEKQVSMGQESDTGVGPTVPAGSQEDTEEAKVYESTAELPEEKN